MHALEVTNLHLQYGGMHLLRGISLKLHTGELGCLLGVTGSGKTALLRAIAGFVEPHEGEVRIGEQLMNGLGTFIPPERRHTGLVFQDYNLFPHRTISENIAWGLRYQSRANMGLRIEKLLEVARISHKADAYPHQLSGGERQRAALARAMAPKPKLILLDEPFASQDSNLRETLALEVKSMLKSEQITALMVTHDQTEAFALADQLGVLHDGTIAQWENPYHLYHHPANRAIAEFIGVGTTVKGVVVNATTVNSALGQIKLEVDMERFRKQQNVQVFIRPEDIEIDVSGSKRKALVLESHFKGHTMVYRLRCEKTHEIFYATAPSRTRLLPGDTTNFSLRMQDLILFLENHAHLGSEEHTYASGLRSIER